jgi:hypothetical protein
MSSQSQPVWGAAAIGQVINRTEQQTHYLLRQGLIKSARKVGAHWCATPAALRREFGAVDVERQRDEVA